MRKDLLKTGFFAVVVAAVFSFAVLEIKSFQNEEAQKEESKRVLPFEGKDIVKVEYQKSIFEKEIHRKSAQVWRARGEVFSDLLDYPQLITWFDNMTEQEARPLSVQSESVDWAKFGFNTGAKSVRLTLDSGKVWAVELSSQVAFDDSRYLKVTNPEGNQTLVSSSERWPSFLSHAPEDFRVKEAFNWEALDIKAQVRAIRFEKKKLEKKAVWTSEQKPGWTFSQEAIESHHDTLKTLKSIQFFSETDIQLGSPFLTYEVELDTGLKHKAELFKSSGKVYLKNSFRPGLLLELKPNETFKFTPSFLSLRSTKDVFNPKSFEDLIAMHFKDFVFEFKNGEWTVAKGPEPKKAEAFNGALVEKLFSEFQNLKHIGYLEKSPKKLKSLFKVELEGKEQNLKYTVFQNSIKCRPQAQEALCYGVQVKNSFLVIEKTQIENFLNFTPYESPEKKQAAAL